MVIDGEVMTWDYDEEYDVTNTKPVGMFPVSDGLTFSLFESARVNGFGLGRSPARYRSRLDLWLEMPNP